MYLGIDISKDRLDCHKLDNEYSEAKQFKNDKQGIKALVAWSVDCQQVVMEATGVYWQSCAFAIYEAGIAVSVVNPARVKHFGRMNLVRGKTDKMDAKLIAEFSQMTKPKLWRPPTDKDQELQTLVRERDVLVADLTQLKNRKHAHAHRQLCPISVQTCLDERIILLKSQIKRLEKEIEEMCQQEFQDSYQSLRSIPGIGSVTASVLLAETQALKYFYDAKQLTAYTGIAPKPNESAGIAPKPNESGNSKHKSPISKIGNKRIRKAFYLAALRACRSSVFKDLYERILKRSHSKKLALIAVARKLLVIAFTLVKSNQRFDPNFINTRA